MKLSDTITIPAEVMARQIEDETVILNLATGTYFGLDLVGARIWQLLSEGNSLAVVCDVMCTEFEVSRTQLEQDVLELLAQLNNQGLVQIQASVS
jgi:hypothetical protein